MFTRKIGLFLSAFTLAAAFGATAAIAQDASDANASAANCYTLASLRGSYAIVGTYGSNEAIALGVRSLDGNGNFTGVFTVNEPLAGSTTGERKIVTGTQAGTYTVNCDGTGVITRVLSVAGVQTNQVDDFVITGAVLIKGVRTATSLVDAQRTSSVIIPGGVFLRRAWNRIP